MNIKTKKTVAFLLMCSLFLGVFTSSSGILAQTNAEHLVERLEVLSGDVWKTVATDGKKELRVNPSSGEIQVYDATLGLTMSSYPETEGVDSYNAANMRSALIIQHINDKNTISETNSLEASVRQGGLITHRIQNGAVFTYTMPQIGITIPVSCVLQDGELFVSVLTAEIREEKEYKLLECTLMPYLGSATSQDTGYLLVPDGSGALIDFSPEAPIPSTLQYKEPVYGRDPMGTVLRQNGDKEQIKISVFAVKTAERMVMGLITEGDALASIEVTARGNKNFAVHAIMTYRKTMIRTLLDASKEKKEITTVAKNAAKITRFTVRYSLLGKSDYNNIAKKTVQWYTQQGGNQGIRQDTSAAVTLQILGAVPRQESMAGIPVKKAYAATTYAQAKDVVQRLQAVGVSALHVVYQGLFDGGLYDKMPLKGKIETALGSVAELKELDSLLAQNGSTLFPAADLARIYTNGNGISYQNDAARDYSGGIREIVPYSAVTYAPQKEALSYTLLAPRKTADVYTSFVRSLGRLGLRSFADMGVSQLFSDNPHTILGKKTFVDRQRALELQIHAVQQAVTELDGYMTDNAAGYLFPYTDYIIDTPSTSSRIDGFTREIPFYSLVASSFAQLTAEAVNFSEDADVYWLRCVEYGLLPSAYICGCATDELVYTDANWLYSAQPDAICAWIEKLSKEHKETLSLVGSSALVKHEWIADGVYKSYFSSGKTAVVNYTDTAVSVDDVLVPAAGYIIGGDV